MGEKPDSKDIVGGGVSDLLGAGTVAQILLDALARGIGPVLNPLADRWRDHNQRKDLSAHIKTLRSEGLELSAAELTLDGRATLRISAERARTQDNREAIAVFAIEEARQSQERLSQPDQIELESEWIDHFWDLAGRVSSEDKQRFWGRILARAASSAPISARTLSLLSTLSGEEARQLERIAKYAVRINDGDWIDVGLIRSVSQRRIAAGSPEAEALEACNLRMSAILGHVPIRLFGSIGIFVEDGWAFGFRRLPTHGRVDFSIAGVGYSIRPGASPVRVEAPDSHKLTFANGIEFAPMGQEILSLIDVEPDQEMVDAMAAAIACHGWILCRDDGTPVLQA